MRISDWSSDVCSSDLPDLDADPAAFRRQPLVHLHEHVVSQILADREAGGGDGLAAFHAEHVEAEALAQFVEHRDRSAARSEEHTSELQSLMRISYAVFCLKKKKHNIPKNNTH